MPLVNGVYKRLQSWAARQAAGAPISAVEFDADGNDEAAALSTALMRDGTSTVVADLPMASHTHTGIRKAAAPGEPVEYAQWQAGSGSIQNLLHNASLNVNQRGVSGTVTLAAGAYGHDRWKAGASGCTYTFFQTGTDTTITITAGSLVQVVSGFDVDAKVYTLSNAGTAQGRIYQGGSAGAPALAACPVTTLAALSGGAAAFVEFGPGTVLEPQLEAGATAHSFTRRPLILDLMLCQAFYEVRAFRFGADAQTAIPLLPIFFKVTKVAVPTCTATLTLNPFGVAANAVNLTTDSVSYGFSGSNTQVLVGGTITASCEP